MHVSGEALYLMSECLGTTVAHFSNLTGTQTVMYIADNHSARFCMKASHAPFTLRLVSHFQVRDL